MDGRFDQVGGIIEQGIREGLHLGAQLYVWRAGTVLVDAAFGEARTGVPMTSHTLTLWFSAGKPLTATAIAVLVEQGKLSWNTRVAEVLPPFAARGKDNITVAHVLTHTAGLHAADEIEPLPWKERVARICESALPDGWVPGQRAAYSPAAGWFILGEVVRVVSGQPLAEFLQKQVFQPFQMNNTRLCFGPEEVTPLREQAGFMYNTNEAPRPLEFWNSEEGLERCVPGGSARGPVRELGRFYQAFLDGGAPVVSRPTSATMISRQRSGLFDETFQYKLDSGYGFILNSNRDGFQMPYGYGRAASPGTFGHSGNQSSCAFADPDRELVVAWVTNGMPGERKHQQRQRAINNAIYDALGEAI